MKRHPNKDIQSAVDYALSKNWSLVIGSGKSHAWGRLMCLYGKRGGCIISVWSTPQVPENHAKKIIKSVDKCPHAKT